MREIVNRNVGSMQMHGILMCRPPPYPNLKFVRDGQKLTHPSSVVENWLATTVDSNMQDVEIPELNKLGFESGTFEDGNNWCILYHFPFCLKMESCLKT